MNAVPTKAASQDKIIVKVGSREVQLTTSINPTGRTWVPEADLIDYYYNVAPFILPHLKDRPLSLVSGGIESEGSEMLPWHASGSASPR